MGIRWIGLTVLLLFSLTACGETAVEDSAVSERNSTAVQENLGDETLPARVPKAECSTVYAEVLAVNGTHLTVGAGDRTMALTVETELLVDWNEGDQVILYYTGDFGDAMQVHYIDKWTENSEVEPPKTRDEREEQNEGVITE